MSFVPINTSSQLPIQNEHKQAQIQQQITESNTPRKCKLFYFIIFCCFSLNFFLKNFNKMQFLQIKDF